MSEPRLAVGRGVVEEMVRLAAIECRVSSGSVAAAVRFAVAGAVKRLLGPELAEVSVLVAGVGA